MPNAEILAGMRPVVAMKMATTLAISSDFRTDRVCGDRGSDTRITFASNGFTATPSSA